MKKIKINTIAFLFAIFINCLKVEAQTVLPPISVLDLNGIKKDVRTIKDSTKYSLLVFWTIWSHISQLEINNLNEINDEVMELNTEIILINFDDSRNSYSVLPLVTGRNWPFKCYRDVNSDLKRFFNIINVPSSILLNNESKIIWTKVGFFDGDEITITQKIRELRK